MIGERTRAALEREKMLALRADQGARVRPRDGEGVRRRLPRDVGPPARARGAPDASSSTPAPATASRSSSDLAKRLGERRRRAGARPCATRRRPRESAPACSTRRTIADAQVLQGLRSEAVTRTRPVMRPGGWSRPCCRSASCCAPVRRRALRAQFADARPEADVGHSAAGRRPADRHRLGARHPRRRCRTTSPDQPVELHVGGKVQTVKTDETAARSSTSCRPGATLKAVAVVDGERLESQEFPGAGAGRHPADARRHRQGEGGERRPRRQRAGGHRAGRHRRRVADRHRAGDESVARLLPPRHRQQRAARR